MPRAATWALLAAAIAIIAFFLLVEPIPQDPAYHIFADGRSLLGIPNFWNVVSNLPFILVGAYGLMVTASHPTAVGESSLYWPWLTFCAGLILTALGSAWYHVAPTNATLVWDRLPMTLGFAGFLTILIGEYLSLAAARALFLPILLAGVGSVVYWNLTETAGAGDLRPYAVVAIFPLLATPAILIARRDQSDLTSAMWVMLAYYGAAKLCEHFDAATFQVLGVISGHSLKHLFAALSGLVLLQAIRRRAAQPETINA